MSDSILLRAENITKSYAGVQALKSASFELRAGEVHALVGENGAGKSTLVKIITGAIEADDGKLEIGGRTLAHNSPRIASGTLNSSNDLFGLPTEFISESNVQQPITTAEYNTWATINGQPLASTTAGAAQLAQIRAMVNAFRLPGGASLPADFFHVQLPQGLATKAATSYDITTLNGFKLYRLRQTYGTGFG